MQKLTLTLAAASLMLAATTSAQAAAGRDYISVVGSSTVYPFTTAVAEQFGKTSKFKTPKIESTGTGGGIKLFCAGSGVDTPDIANASRRIKKTEMETCAKNGVNEVVEVKVGYDGIVVANSRKAEPFSLTRQELFMALAKQVPDADGKLVANPYKTWKEINPALPETKIEVLGPPPTSGTRDAFLELVMDPGCEAFASIKAMKKTDEKQFKTVCQTVREDGAYIDAGENDNLIVQKLAKDKDAFGIFGYSFLEENEDSIQGTAIGDVLPTPETVASGKYPISRSLYFYVKNAHYEAIPGLKEYVELFMSDKMIGKDGLLKSIGLIPLPEDKLVQARQTVLEKKKLTLDELKKK